MDEKSEFILNGETDKKDVIIISFGGMAQKLMYPPYEFLKFLSNIFPEHDKIFYVDKHQCWYHKGIKGITHNIDETVLYLKEKIKCYKKVVFIGSSAGGYAAILFGSLLKVDTVITFIPQTNIEGLRDFFDIKYTNLKDKINDETRYIIYGDPNKTYHKDVHCIDQCLNISEKRNVDLIQIPDMNIKEFRDSGELVKLFEREI